MPSALQKLGNNQALGMLSGCADSTVRRILPELLATVKTQTKLRWQRGRGCASSGAGLVMLPFWKHHPLFMLDKLLSEVSTTNLVERNRVWDNLDASVLGSKHWKATFKGRLRSNDGATLGQALWDIFVKYPSYSVDVFLENVRLREGVKDLDINDPEHSRHLDVKVPSCIKLADLPTESLLSYMGELSTLHARLLPNEKQPVIP